ncbi:MAG: hypothetical protein ACOX7F_08770 [Eubacteriales bacterium]
MENETSEMLSLLMERLKDSSEITQETYEAAVEKYGLVPVQG